jgi:hypothetical protein
MVLPNSPYLGETDPENNPISDPDLGPYIRPIPRPTYSDNFENIPLLPPNSGVSINKLPRYVETGTGRGVWEGDPSRPYRPGIGNESYPRKPKPYRGPRTTGEALSPSGLPWFNGPYAPNSYR